MGGLSEEEAERYLAEYDVEIRSQLKQIGPKVKRHPWLDMDDLHTVAQVTVLEAVIRYVPGRDCTLRTWVGKLISWRLREALQLPEDRQCAEKIRAEKIRSGEKNSALDAASLESIRDDYRHMKFTRYRTITLDLVSTSDGEAYMIAEVLPSPQANPEDILTQKQEVQLLRRAIEHAPIDFRARLVFGSEMTGTTNSALARELGLTRQRIDQIRQLGVLPLRKQIEVEQAALTPSELRLPLASGG